LIVAYSPLSQKQVFMNIHDADRPAAEHCVEDGKGREAETHVPLKTLHKAGSLMHTC